MKQKLQALNSARALRVTGLVLADAVLINLASFLALFLRHEFSLAAMLKGGFLDDVLRYMPVNTVITIAVFAAFRIYRSLWEYASVPELLSIAEASAVSALTQAVGMMLMKMSFPRSHPVLYAMLLAAFVAALRFSYRYFRRERRRSQKQRKRTMLIGAGAAGAMALREFNHSDHSENQIVCIVDDDPAKKGTVLMNVPVVGGRDELQKAAEKYRVEEIVLAIPTLPHTERRKYIELCSQTRCRLKTLPALYQLANGEVSIKSVRNVEIEDLLGRETVRVDMEGICGYIAGKTVLVTGGGGSIGSELCRQIAKSRVGHLIIFDIYENNAYDIQQELRRNHPELKLTVLIGSVRDRKRVFDVMEQYRPQLVFHAAAHKHVPLMEDSPAEAVKNNVFGTLNLAEAALEYGVQRFLLISTDKAVNPTNVMGASKRMCEMVLQMLVGKGKTEFLAVRFGNVLGSNGSVIPLFRRQIKEGGPVTVTDKNVIRYFMTIPEAVSLVLQAGAYAKGGEVFVLDMGEPVRIDDLARNMIRLSGFEPDVDIKVVYTGLRPGEKLFEEILMDAEGMEKTANNLIYIGKEAHVDEALFRSQLESLRDAEDLTPAQLRALIERIVPTYHPSLVGAGK